MIDLRFILLDSYTPTLPLKGGQNLFASGWRRGGDQTLSLRRGVDFGDLDRGKSSEALRRGSTSKR